ncbi:hypothetical protein VRRI112168_03385 [Vreelandella rituensis]|uniref:Uncharacterized protein n=1 Tax=Vreelandella rituensis TaxID=2282306 RepID=A0A368UAP2_9GAMM|nr:hypothetical protein [Halomonas rituensis]RCV93696.1 hypothetical protein DU506_00655 [Halomonas rituensis]
MSQATADPFIALLGNTLVAPVYWHACHQWGIEQVNETVLAHNGATILEWPHTRALLKARAGSTLSELDTPLVLDHIRDTIVHCVENDLKIEGGLLFDDVWSMESTGRTTTAVQSIPSDDLALMTAAPQRIAANLPMPKGRLGRNNPEPSRVLTREPTGGLIRVAMSSLGEGIPPAMEAVFLVEEQFKARDDLYVSEGTFLIPLDGACQATEAAWLRWIPNSTFFSKRSSILGSDNVMAMLSATPAGSAQPHVKPGTQDDIPALFLSFSYPLGPTETAHECPANESKPMPPPEMLN